MPLLGPLVLAGRAALSRYGGRVVSRVAARISPRAVAVGGAVATVAAGTAVGNRLSGWQDM